MTGRPTVLVPVRVLEGEAIPEGVPELLAQGHVILLGYHVIPEQTAPGQARMQWEDQGLDRLDDLEHLFVEAGATVDARLVFTHDAQQTVNRQVREHDAMAVLVPDAVVALEEVLVPVQGTVGSDRLAQVVAGLFGDSDLGITLLHVADEAETDEDAATLLEAVATALVDLGVAESAIETRTERDVEPLDAIIESSGEADVVVMGESDPSLATYFFGMPADKVNERFLGPVLVVQRTPPASPDEE